MLFIKGRRRRQIREIIDVILLLSSLADLVKEVIGLMFG